MENNIKSRNDKIKFMQENYAWIAATTTGIGVIMLNIFKFLEHLGQNMRFTYYGLDINLYKYEDKNFIYNLCLTIVFMLAFYSLMYCYYQIANNVKNKRYMNWDNFIDVILIIISNIYIITTFKLNTNFILTVAIFIFLVILEIITAYFMFKIVSKEPVTEAETRKKELINYFKLLPFYVILLIFLVLSMTGLSLTMNKNYRIIVNAENTNINNKVIVYSNNEYYLTLDCEIENDSIVIYTGTQTKIDNINVYSIYKEFNTVKIK